MYGGVSIRDVNSREIAFPGRELQFRPGLRRRGTHVETHAGNATGDAVADQTPGTGDLQARRQTWPDDRPTSRVVGTFDVCSNAAVNIDLSCFLYRGRLKRPHLH